MVKAAVVEIVMAEMTMVKLAMIESAMMEPIVAELSGVREELVMVEECSTVMPVVSPVAPAPPKASEVSDSKSNTERESHAAPKNSGHRIPPGVSDDRRTVHEPRIVGRNIDPLRTSRLDDDRASLCGYLFLFIIFQVPGVLSLLAHYLDGIGHILRGV